MKARDERAEQVEYIYMTTLLHISTVFEFYSEVV